jgi:hypothetical protein
MQNNLKEYLKQAEEEFQLKKALHGENKTNYSAMQMHYAQGYKNALQDLLKKEEL